MSSVFRCSLCFNLLKLDKDINLDIIRFYFPNKKRLNEHGFFYNASSNSLLCKSHLDKVCYEIKLIKEVKENSLDLYHGFKSLKRISVDVKDQKVFFIDGEASLRLNDDTSRDLEFVNPTTHQKGASTAGGR